MYGQKNFKLNKVSFWLTIILSQNGVQTVRGFSYVIFLGNRAFCETATTGFVCGGDLSSKESNSGW